MHSLLLLAISLGIIGVGLKIREEVFRLSITVTGGFLLVWGFALTPSHHKLIIELGLLVPVCAICSRYLRK
ncbi:MAG: hypothetical protein SAJ37_05325 [Oscillatoria sp. PMC 1068.18]|nr:hypothetical protein [Oscillatoria sp. PMC 1076.18]MEC4988152.1 hypothetical protein [Oscillatoria sp. PMC 1068.18]